ncbi:hypothetical protein BaRGS_00035456 [Batillaria attramentaria]|uniref:Uncharacterized protein n=1 Tax=Batillaria attramentaria TaxID=370345 RepID=A0ABD0JEY1_9CAEN
MSNVGYAFPVPTVVIFNNKQERPTPSCKTHPSYVPDTVSASGARTNCSQQNRMFCSSLPQPLSPAFSRCQTCQLLTLPKQVGEYERRCTKGAPNLSDQHPQSIHGKSTVDETTVTRACPQLSQMSHQ